MSDSRRNDDGGTVSVKHIHNGVCTNCENGERFCSCLAEPAARIRAYLLVNGETGRPVADKDGALAVFLRKKDADQFSWHKDDKIVAVTIASRKATAKAS